MIEHQRHRWGYLPLESLLEEVYVSTYKLQSVALWVPMATIEFAILDMLGRITNKSITDLIGGGKRTNIPYYVASGRRDSTPEEEIDYLEEIGNGNGAFDVGDFRAWLQSEAMMSRGAPTDGEEVAP